MLFFSTYSLQSLVAQLSYLYCHFDIFWCTDSLQSLVTQSSHLYSHFDIFAVFILSKVLQVIQDLHVPSIVFLY